MAKIGRPSEYKPEYINTYREYIEYAIPENQEIPTIEGLALRIGVSRRALYRWAKKHKEFRHTLGELKMKQKEALTKIGIFGGKEINATIVQLLLKVNHNMVETDRHEMTGKDGAPLGVVVLPEIYESKNNMAAPDGTADGGTKEA